MKILVVDDDQAIRDLFTQVLQKVGYEIILATDGKSAIEKAQQEHPDLILLDQVLPDMSGNDILKRLKSDPVTSPVPIAIVSNYSQESMMQEALKNGATDYILKYQIEAEDLKQKVEQIIKDAKSMSAIENQKVQ